MAISSFMKTSAI